MALLALLMGVKTISPQDLQRLMAESQVTVLDVNSRESWMGAHVPGALNLNPVDYKESELPLAKASALVFYCSNPMCRKAPNAARRAKNMGYGNVRVMSAGISGWLDDRLPTESGK